MSYSNNPYDEHILNAHHLKVRADGTLSEADQAVYNKQVAIAGKISAKEKEAQAAVAGVRARYQISPEMERANILYEKTKKYMPTVMKQAGLQGLGVAQSTMLQAQNEHLGRMNALRYERDRKAELASGLTADAYRGYIEELKGESANVDLRKAKEDIEALYGGEGSVTSKESGFADILGRYADSPEVQAHLTEYAKTFQAGNAAVDKLFSFYTPGETAEAEGITAEQYKDFWDQVKQDRIFNWYKTLGAFEQDAVDAALESRGVASVEDMALEAEVQEKEAAEILAAQDEEVIKKLITLGAGYNENGEFVYGSVTPEAIEEILEDESLPMSDELRQSLKKHAEITRGRERAETEQGWLAKFEATAPENLDAVGAEKYLAQIQALKDEVSPEFYDKYVQPEITEMEAVWKEYLDTERTKNEALRAAQAAGEKPIEGSDGKKWYVAQSPEGDVEGFMSENKEAVNEALGEFGNEKNPNIPDGTVIKVNGVSLYYDKTEKSWHYLTDSQPQDSVSPGVFGTEDKAYKDVVVRGIKLRVASNGVVYRSHKMGASILPAVKEGDLKELGLGSEAKDGTVVQLENKKKAVSFYGRWYYLK